MMLRLRFAALPSAAVALLAGCRADIVSTSRSIAIGGGLELDVGQTAALTVDSVSVIDGTPSA